MTDTMERVKSGIIHGDSLVVLPTFDDNSVDAVVTDPPYELGFMGKSWDASGIAYSVELWREALRVLKPGGHLLAFGGSRTYHRLACAVEDAGFEIRDQIMWVYGSGFPKSHNLKGDREGWGTALKPAHEPIVVARKPLEGTVAANVLKWGTGALNIDGTRVSSGDSENFVRPVNHTNLHEGWQRPWHTNPHALEREKKQREKSADKASELGRWPANFIHDGSDEAMALFPETAGGARPAKANKRTGEHYEGGWGTIEEGPRIEFAGGSAARFFYCAKASKAERNAGVPEGTPGHPTVKPIALMRYLIRLVTPPGGVVLDPFAGSGTTLVAATLENMSSIGIEMTDDYLPIIDGRVAWAKENKETDTLF